MRSRTTTLTDRPQSTRRMVPVVAALVLLLGACSGSSKQDDAASRGTTVATTASIRVLPPDDFAAFIAAHPDAPLVNVHIPYEGHIEGTDAFVAFDEIGDWDGLPKDKGAPFVLYCRSGNMSATASDTLASMGYTDIIDLKGGMNAWTASGRDLVVEKPAT